MKHVLVIVLLDGEANLMNLPTDRRILSSVSASCQAVRPGIQAGQILD